MSSPPPPTSPPNPASINGNLGVKLLDFTADLTGRLRTL